MANTFIKIYLHIVFAVKHRNSCIDAAWRNRLYSYISSIFENKQQYVIKIGGVSDHIHILISYNAKIPLPDLIRDVKTASTNFVNKERLAREKFSWQKGYACMSYSQSQLDDVSRYIQHQPEHHNKMSVRDEVRTMLERYHINYSEDYLFEDV